MSTFSNWAAVRLRERIFRMHGARCAACHAIDDLQIDCIKPIKQRDHGQGFIGRQWFYWKQTRLGNTQLLCGQCQRLKSNRTEEEFRVLLHNTARPQSIPISIKGAEQVQQLRNRLHPTDLSGGVR